MPQGPRPPPGKPAKTQPSETLPPTAGHDSNSWQRSSGRFSGAAKKEYLKWKRQQKALRAEVDGSDDGSDANSQQTSKRLGKTTAGISGHLDTHGSRSPACAAQPQHMHKQRCLKSLQANSATQPLCYRPLAAVSAAPFSLSSMAPSLHSPQGVAPAAAAEPSAGNEAAGSNSSGGSGGDDAVGVTYMPRLDPAEVGFSAEGAAVTMPTRPRWQGVVSTAEELHALEEAEFAAWQAALAAQAQQMSGHAATPDATTAANTATTLSTVPPAHADTLPANAAAVAAAEATRGNPSAAILQQQHQQGLADGLWPISCYEGRLDFWRQLWRTLEMSDVICMIVDARNPLLHFSHALYRHITQDHQLPLVLLLNKCDLIPAAAAAAWRGWLQQQLPHVTVIPVSAAKQQAAATASQVLSAVLQQQVVRNGTCIKAQQWVGMDEEELILNSVRRNTHSKRQQGQQQQQEQQQCQQLPTADDGATSGTASSEDECDWSTKPNRAMRKSARRPGHRRAQQDKLAACQSHPGNQQQQLQQRRRRRMQSSATPDMGSDTGEGIGGQDSDAAGSDHAQQQGITPSSSHRDLQEALACLTLERRLSSSAASACSTAAAESASGGVRQRGNVQRDEQRQDDLQPVVVGMLGEPNVGKSSTLNALLGAHRVAVSSHPGRTKHYQTHYMSDKLVLVDCPGIMFPRLHVPPAMQVLFGSSPIASCREPYAVVRYLAEASWPRLQDTLKLAPHLSTLQQQQQQEDGQQPHTQQLQCQQGEGDHGRCAAASEAAVRGGTDNSWSPWTLCEALAVKRHWVLPRSGHLDTYRAANWLLRAALAGQHGVGLAFLPPADAAGADGQQQSSAAARGRVAAAAVPPDG